MANEVLAQPALWGAVGGLVVAVFNQAFTFWKEHRHRRDEHQRERTRTALTVAVALESFALDCANCIERIQVLRKLPGPFSHPDFPALEMPASPDWRWVRPHLASEILGLALKVKASHQQLPKGPSLPGSPNARPDGDELCRRKSLVRFCPR
ncbi:hypothetical protein [Cupriavidus sp. IK-TO18]|uniref:hypothetical protein n=1 Tax=Cupriavidus sp. IK-TO18 TaxID=2782182 RepID=UPI001897C8FC|nr:hypothetical protein [Cupriavidus sp. IK-TO18]MBF6989427.1 hypothetical protein [Cupriavidus sp. IK-TO18]